MDHEIIIDESSRSLFNSALINDCDMFPIFTDNDSPVGDRTFVSKLVITETVVLCFANYAHNASACCDCYQYWKGMLYYNTIK